MARWEPDARGRLEKAAMELFVERGYARTTVEEIAARAGLTERTFFRHFADKREVLFFGSEELEKAVVARILSAPRDEAAFDVVIDAVLDAANALQRLRDMAWVRARWALVTEHAELREREVMKLASLVASIAESLRARGVKEPVASVAAEAGIAAFKVGFERWVATKKPSDFAAQVRAAVDALRAIATPSTKRTKTPKSGTRRPR